MSKPVIFIISAVWDQEASVWSGHCDDIPAAADAPTLDELLAKISAMALDLLPDNHPEVDPASLFLQITALREAEPAAVWMAPQFDRALRDLLRAAGCTFVRQDRGSHEIWHSPITKRNFAVPVGIPSRHTANAILRQAGLPKAFWPAAVKPHARGVAEALARRGKAGEALALAQSIAEDTARADALRGIAEAMP
jgi:hypothetical protein